MAITQPIDCPNTLLNAPAAGAANGAGAAGLRGDGDAGGDAFGEGCDVRDDADVFAVGAQLGERFQRAVQRFFVQRAEAFVEEEGVHLHGFAAHLREAECQRQADDEALAAGEVFRAADFTALVVVDDVGFEWPRRVGGEQVAVA